ncbi:glycosyltransferase [Sinorhizobium medicae]|uniref:glycosyltransferase n=1 Tax=Sinorhizobium medicae TaxID=110321 RepID=UPI000C7A80B3|nr:glycosyltransferase [Sinorhizobium medicae]MDX1016515.1 glycosyltransferase [Sinorhizobium medicae]PLU46984.1 hypothetical protein BMJ25_17355 [Sinorhizobium medicae]RVI88606.1 glycosyltransferase [Sinorhizobium meliloti]
MRKFHYLRRRYLRECSEPISAEVVIIVPVFNAPDCVDRCLSSIKANTNVAHRLIVIDDGSTDPAIETLLHVSSWPSNVEIVRHSENRGYTQSINEGIGLAGRSDVILLNSDTEVPPRWVQNLVAAANSSEEIGTVTALSDNAGAFSAPVANRPNDLPTGAPFDRIARAITQDSRRRYPRVPTGNGFCLYIKRACLDDVGHFDAQKFPRGYGEENDFCLRASARGWAHIIDDATYVRHARSASFGLERESLVRQGLTLVCETFPRYRQALLRMRKNKALEDVRGNVRSSIARAVAAEPPIRPRILFVISTLVGGTPRTNEDLMYALGQEVESFVLHSDARRLTLLRFVEGQYRLVASHRLRRSLAPFPHDSREYQAVVRRWLNDYSIELIHIRHMAWHGLGLARSARLLGLPVVMSFHDYYSICPSVRLLDKTGIHRPDNLAPASALCRHVLWKEGFMARFSKVHSLGEWRMQMSRFLGECSVFITTSNQTRELHERFFPIVRDKPFHVIPHGRSFETFKGLGRFPDSGAPMRVLVPGNISVSKGASILADVATRMVGDHVEFHVIGKANKALQNVPNIVIHGTYNREDFAERVEAISPHMGLILSVWPETYCHTLTEMWSCGLPVAAFDVGAVGERINRCGGGWLISRMSAIDVIHTLKCIQTDQAGFSLRLTEVVRWQLGEGTQNTCDAMAQAYLDAYRQLMFIGHSSSGGAQDRGDD